MKKMSLFVLLVSLVLFAAKKDEQMLNQQIMDLQEKNVVLRTNNQKLKTANRTLESDKKAINEKNLALESTVKAKQIEIKNLIETNKKLRSQVQSMKVAIPDTIYQKAPQKVAVAPAAPTLRVPQFPLQVSLIKDPKKHDASNLAVLLTFHNSSAKSLQGFVGVLQFHQNGTILLEATVNISKVIAAGGDMTWYGAIPYDASNQGNVKLSQMDAGSIQVLFDAQTVTMSNGVVQKVK